MSAGRRAFTPLQIVAPSSATLVVKLIVCPVAWTPASVLPAPVTRTASVQRLPSARSSSPWIVGAFGWTWKPA